MKYILCFVALLHLVTAQQDDDAQIVFRRNQKEFIVLNCTLPGDIGWFKNGSLIKEDKDHIMITKGTGFVSLEIKPKVADIGNYTCQQTGDGARSDSRVEFRVSMEPHVAEFTSSANVVEGEKLTLPCQVTGSPIPTVEWSRKGEGEDVWDRLEEGENIEFATANDVLNSVLILKSAKMEDRDDYMCRAFNNLGSSNSTVLIRVIDKYAALWPFLGICAEVIVLCVVIFIFERRRTQKQFEESDTEQTNSKQVVNAKDSELRNRK